MTEQTKKGGRSRPLTLADRLHDTSGESISIASQARISSVAKPHSATWATQAMAPQDGAQLDQAIFRICGFFLGSCIPPTPLPTALANLAQP